VGRNVHCDWPRRFDEGYERGRKLAESLQHLDSEYVDPVRNPFRLGCLLYVVRTVVRNSRNVSRDQTVALFNARLDAEHALKRRISD